MQRQITITTAIKAFFSFEVKNVAYHINKGYQNTFAL